MTAIELHQQINNWYDKNGIEIHYPSPSEIDTETFLNVLDFCIRNSRITDVLGETYVAFGVNGGIMFKGIEFMRSK